MEQELVRLKIIDLAERRVRFLGSAELAEHVRARVHPGSVGRLDRERGVDREERVFDAIGELEDPGVLDVQPRGSWRERERLRHARERPIEVAQVGECVRFDREPVGVTRGADDVCRAGRRPAQQVPWTSAAVELERPEVERVGMGRRAREGRAADRLGETGGAEPFGEPRREERAFHARPRAEIAERTARDESVDEPAPSVELVDRGEERGRVRRRRSRNRRQHRRRLRMASALGDLGSVGTERPRRRGRHARRA